MRASAGSSLVAAVMDLPSFSLTVTALMRVFVLAGCCDSSGRVAASCCSDVRCCFGWLPSVMLSSSCLLDEKAPPGLLAGVMDGDMTLSEVGVFGSGDSVMESMLLPFVSLMLMLRFVLVVNVVLLLLLRLL